jgi:hypothetical protein
MKQNEFEQKGKDSMTALTQFVLGTAVLFSTKPLAAPVLVFGACTKRIWRSR